MTDTWRTLPEGAAAGLSGTETREQASDAPSDGGELRNDLRAALAKIARVEAVIAPMHEDWCRAKHDPGRECECIHAEIRKAIDGDS